MKKILFYAFILFSLTGIGELYANIDNLSNMSAEWIRTGNRNAATDAADIVVYNPAGITALGDGIHVNVGNQTLMRKPEHSYDLTALGGSKESHKQDGIDWFLPNLYVTYNQDNWAVFGGYYICGGGAVVNYPDGSVTTDMIGLQAAGPGAYSDEYLKADSYYNTFELGGAYKINDMISLAIGARYLYVKNTTEAGFTAGGSELKLRTEDTGDGFGAIFGVNINLTKEINFAAQYQSQINLKLKTDEKQDDFNLVTDGEKNRRDLPAVFGMGLGYDITDKLYAEINYSYWFQKNCNWGKDDNGKDIAKMAGDAQSAGITASYRVLPELLVSAGTTYTDFKWNDMNGYYQANLGSYEVLYTDNWHLGCGVAYTVVKDVVLNLSFARTIWEDKSLTYRTSSGDVEIKTKNSTTIIAVGVDAKF